MLISIYFRVTYQSSESPSSQQQQQQQQQEHNNDIKTIFCQFIVNQCHGSPACQSTSLQISGSVPSFATATTTTTTTATHFHRVVNKPEERNTSCSEGKNTTIVLMPKVTFWDKICITTFKQLFGKYTIRSILTQVS